MIMKTIDLQSDWRSHYSADEWGNDIKTMLLHYYNVPY